MLELVPITLKEANAFVEQHHRHHKPVVGHKFSIAASDGEKIVGVAIVGRPVSRYLDNGLTLEVNRLCTDGTRNACSFLYSAAWRAARNLGYKKLITYILVSETGSSLKAAGWKCVGECGGLRWNGRSAPKVDLYPAQMKLRFEIGEAENEQSNISHICGLPFSGYLGKIETPRPSGNMDEVVIAFEENTPFKQNGVEFDVLREFAAGSRLLVAGKMQTLKDFESGRVLVYVLAEFVALSPKAMQQDDVAVVGELAYKPVHRVTPRGKHIADMFVKVQNVLTAGTCYIPCICWQETADEAAEWQQGDKVKLLGRYQSREYSKLKDIDNEESRETRTAYELWIQQNLLSVWQRM